MGTRFFFMLLLLGASPVAASEVVVLCLGDSLTEGYGVGEHRAWPQLVQTSLREDGEKIALINAGVSGSTSASGLSRLRWHLKTKAMPDILILALGGNDGLRGQDLEAMSQNLASTIDLAKEKGIRVLLAGMRIPTNYGKTYTEAFATTYPSLAKEKGVALIPFLLEDVAARPSKNLPDRIHPNAAGHRIIAQTVKEHLLPLLKP